MDLCLCKEVRVVDPGRGIADSCHETLAFGSRWIVDHRVEVVARLESVTEVDPSW